jgi:putative FmdB family regulatory protein
LPTYSYKCTECGTAFDIHQEFTDATLTECPNCGGKLRKVFSAVGVTFNGSGFYRNDSRGTKSSSDGKSASTGSGASTGSATGTGDSKPSTPTESTKAATPKPAAS